MADEDQAADHQPWTERALLLLVLGAVFGIAFESLIDSPYGSERTENPWRMAGASLLAVGGIVFAFSLERLRWLWAILFALGAGLVVAFITYWNGSPERWGAGEGWQFFAALLAVVIAVPLFQTIRDAGRWQLDYRAVHAHAWTNVVLSSAACAFVLLVFLLAYLLSALFDLIGIEVLKDLLRKDWFGWMLGCGALGAAIGLLRDRDKVIGLLQRVVMTLLSVLAPALAIGLLLFVLALPFTGLGPLWDQTRATTPILLGCILGAIILANATIGNAPEEEAKPPLLRYGAIILSGVMLPLAIVAAISTGKRIGQYGLTPDRLWAAVFVGVALIFALAYFASLVRGRLRWPDFARRANVALAMGLCGLALFLALPLVSFGAISTRDQLARLQSGRIAPAEFDWAALRFDFGTLGRNAVRRLARTGTPAVKSLAARALASTDRWDAVQTVREAERTVKLERSLRILPTQVPAPADLRAAIGRADLCQSGECTLFWPSAGNEALLIGFRCDGCDADQERLIRDPVGKWLTEEDQRRSYRGSDDRGLGRAQAEALQKGDVTIRTVSRRQLVVGGRPVGEPFE